MYSKLDVLPVDISNLKLNTPKSNSLLVNDSQENFNIASISPSFKIKNNSLFSINLETSKKALYSYKVKDINKLNITTKNANILISNNDDNQCFSIETIKEPKLNNGSLSVDSSNHDITLKISGNKHYSIKLNLTSTNGNITTIGKAKIQQGGYLQAENGNIKVGLDNEYVYLRKIACYRGNSINKSSNVTNGEPITLVSYNGDIYT